MRSRLAFLVLLAGCATPEIQRAETPYYLEQLAAARTAPSVQRGDGEAIALREAVSRLAARFSGETKRIGARDETEGLLDIESPVARDFLARLANPQHAEDALTSAPLDIEHLLLAVYARSPAVAAARAEWAAAAQTWSQAAFLEERLLRARPFSGETSQPFPAPGVLTARAEMTAAEVSMAREAARRSLLDALVGAASAYHVVTHHEEELRNRDEQLALADRLLDSMRREVESGMKPQTELLMAESERAIAADERSHAAASLAKARAELNAWLGRPVDATLSLQAHEHRVPPSATPLLAPLLDLARRYSPSVRIAQAQAVRADAAVRMQEAMVVETRDAAMSGEPPGVSAVTLEALRHRRTAAQRAADEAVHAADRDVIAAHYQLDAQRRMYELAARTEVPLAADAAAVQRRLFESGRASPAELVAFERARLRALHDAISARHDYLAAEAAIWKAAGARPELAAREETR